MEFIITAVAVSIVIIIPILLWRYRHDNPNRIPKTED
jgi:hypothetical protein